MAVFTDTAAKFSVPVKKGFKLREGLRATRVCGALSLSCFALRRVLFTDWYTSGMTTTIKVSDELRDRLKEQAARDGLTLGAHLAHLADAEDRRWRLHLLKLAIDASTSDDAGSHATETEDWERTELAGAA